MTLSKVSFPINMMVASFTKPHMCMLSSALCNMGVDIILKRSAIVHLLPCGAVLLKIKGVRISKSRSI